MCACAPPSGKIILHIAFFDKGHGKSSGSVACLSGARLERNLECRRREGETLTATSSLRALQFACLRSRRSPDRAARSARGAHNEQPTKEKAASGSYSASGPSFCSKLLKTGAWLRIESDATLLRLPSHVVAASRSRICQPRRHVASMHRQSSRQAGKPNVFAGVLTTGVWLK
jgi:hypothetical protein